MKDQDLIKIIKNGENSLVEFKSSLVHSDSIVKEVAAFSNTAGGSLFIGVEDNGEITGISEEKFEEKIIQICRNNIIPSIIPVIEKYNINDKVIFEVIIDRGRNKPYKVRTSNKFYIRAGSVSIEPTTEELVRLFQEGEIFHFEVKPVPGTSEADLNLNLFYDYCKNYRNYPVTDEDSVSLLTNLQFLSDEGYSTIAGLLCFGKNISRFLPQSGIQLHRFSGTDVTSDVLENREMEGTIPFLIDSAIKFVASNTSVSSTVPEDGGQRIDLNDYDPLIVKEIIVNAFQHRDWSIFGQKIRIRMFSDRIEVFSPGKIPNTLNLKNILYGNSFYRNPLLSQIIKDYGYSDKMGRGLLKVIRRSDELKLKQPVFETDTASFTVIIFRRT